MANAWFRMYAKFVTDPDVQMMSEALQRRLVMLLGMRCSNVSETFQDQEVTFVLRISEQETRDTKAAFIAKGFIDSDWRLLKWEKRQYVADSSTERVRRHRQHQNLGKNDGTESSVTRNVTVTPPDTDTDTDTEQEESKTSASSSFELDAGSVSKESFIGTIPCNGKIKAWPFTQGDVNAWQEAFPGIDVMQELRACKQWNIDIPRRRKTFSGMREHVNRWLNRAQNQHGGQSDARQSYKPTNRAQVAYDSARESTANALAGLEASGLGSRSAGGEDGGASGLIRFPPAPDGRRLG